MINQKNTSLLTFFPRFLKGLKDVINLSKSTDIKINKLLDKFDSLERMKKIVNGDLTDEEVELSLWERHVDYFDKTLTKAQKIELINAAKKAHREKGTRATLDKLLNIIFGDLELQEWFEADLEPYHFQVLSNYEVSDETLKKINRTVNEFKTVRSVFDGFYAIEIIEIPYKSLIGIEDLSEETFEILLEIEIIQDYQKIGLIDFSIETL